MKKMRLMVTYAIALLCVFSVYFYRDSITVINPISNQMFENEGMIFVVDNDQMIVPITLSYQKSDDNAENIMTLIQLMKQNLEITGFETLIPTALHFTRVAIHDLKVTLYVNEAFYAMDSAIELRVIEALVGVVVQFNSDYEVFFDVNGEIAEKMPLSQRPLDSLNQSLGYNNFISSQSNLHQTRSWHEVIQKEQDERFYYMIQTKRLNKEDELIKKMVQPFRHYVDTCEINGNKAVLHVTNQAILDETTLNIEAIKPLIFSLYFNYDLSQFQFILHDEFIQVNGNKEAIVELKQLSLNRWN